MERERQKPAESIGFYSAIGISVGTNVFAAVGGVLDSIPIGIVAGLGVGIAMGTLAGYLNSDKPMPPSRRRRKNLEEAL